MGEKKGFFKKLANSLKKIAPTVVSGVAGEIPIVGDLVAPVLGNLMRKVTGAPADDVDYEAMAEQILGSPELTLEMEKLALERERMFWENEQAKLAADTARIAQVNETMRAEAGADDPWQRRWRPYWGFVSGTVWGILGLSVAVAIVCVALGVGDVSAEAITKIGAGFSDMAVFWAVAGAMLGVTAWKRGDEKIARVKTRNGAGS